MVTTKNEATKNTKNTKSNHRETREEADAPRRRGFVAKYGTH